MMWLDPRQRLSLSDSWDCALHYLILTKSQQMPEGSGGIYVNCIIIYRFPSLALTNNLFNYFSSIFSSDTVSLANKTSINTLGPIFGVSGNWHLKISMQIKGDGFRARYLGNILIFHSYKGPWLPLRKSYYNTKFRVIMKALFLIITNVTLRKKYSIFCPLSIYVQNFDLK